MYKIEITKIETVETQTSGEWTAVDVSFMTKEDWDKLSYWEKEKLEKAEVKDLKKSVYGYAPARKVIEERKIKVLEQTCEEVDLKAVIKAINNI